MEEKTEVMLALATLGLGGVREACLKVFWSEVYMQWHGFDTSTLAKLYTVLQYARFDGVRFPRGGGGIRKGQPPARSDLLDSSGSYSFPPLAVLAQDSASFDKRVFVEHANLCNPNGPRYHEGYAIAWKRERWAAEGGEFDPELIYRRSGWEKKEEQMAAAATVANKRRATRR